MREDNPVLIPQRRLAMTLTVAGLDVHRGCLIRYIISLFQSPKFVNQELTQACMMIFNHARQLFNYIFKLYYIFKKGQRNQGLAVKWKEKEAFTTNSGVSLLSDKSVNSNLNRIIYHTFKTHSVLVRPSQDIFPFSFLPPWCCVCRSR